MQTQAIVSLSVCVGLCLAPRAAAQFTPAQRPLDRVDPRPAIAPGDYNVLLIVLDDLGTDKLGVYGENPVVPRTPRIDKLASNGVRFTRAVVNPVCSATRAAMLTGRYGFRTGMGCVIRRHETYFQLDDAEVLFPELLHDALSGGPVRYATALFGKYHLTVTDDYCHAVRNGFDWFQGSMLNNSNHFSWTHVAAEAGSPPTCNTATNIEWAASVNRADAVAWIADQTDPFFVQFAPNPPHKPQQVPPFDLVARTTRAKLHALGYEIGEGPKEESRYHYRFLHDVTVEAIDTEIGNLLDGIAPDVLDRTMVVLAGDNGTDTNVIRPPQNSAHAKGTLYNLATRTPLIVSGRLIGQRFGTTCDRLVGAVDMWRTLAAFCGITPGRIHDLYPSLPIDGVSFLPLLRNPLGQSARSYAYTEWFSPNGVYPPGISPDLYGRAIHENVYKYLRTQFVDLPTVEELYNIGAWRDDWDETTDLGMTPADPDDAAALTALQDAMDDLSGP